jgi:hypothetical protein
MISATAVSEKFEYLKAENAELNSKIEKPSARNEELIAQVKWF